MRRQKLLEGFQLSRESMPPTPRCSRANCIFLLETVCNTQMLGGLSGARPGEEGCKQPLHLGVFLREVQASQLCTSCVHRSTASRMMRHREAGFTTSDRLPSDKNGD